MALLSKVHVGELRTPKKGVYPWIATSKEAGSIRKKYIRSRGDANDFKRLHEAEAGAHGTKHRLSATPRPDFTLDIIFTPKAKPNRVPVLSRLPYRNQSGVHNMKATPTPIVILAALGSLLTPAFLVAFEGDALLAKFCFECHDDATEKAGFSLESLAPDFVNRSTHAAWIRVHDRIAKREMPPRDQPQPTDDDRRQLLAALAEKLHAASLEHQKDGRVTIRRLNRVEYEHSIHDLLGVGAELRSLLPEDNKVAGFDNISAGLETSATHLVRYQEAADRALAELYPARVLTNAAEIARFRLTGREYLESRQEVHRKGIHPYVQLRGDTFVYGAQLYKNGSVQTRQPFRDQDGEMRGLPVVPGRYRIRASIHALNTDAPIPVTVGLISTDRFGHEKLEHLLDIRDALPNEPRVIEVVADLPANEQAYLSPNSLTLFRNLIGPDKQPTFPDFKGPCLAVDWIEIEGPLADVNGYADYFGGLPRVPARFYDDTLAGKPVPEWRKMHPNEFLKPHNRLRLLSQAPAEDARVFVSRFARRAFRGIADTETIESFVLRAQQLLEDGEPLEDALLTVYKEILCSPFFLFRIEAPGELDDFALASRLSYFLGSSAPDDALLEVASAGELRKPDVLRAQTERLLKDPRAGRFIRRFAGQWLDLDKLHEMKPDQIYAEYDEELAWSIGEETRLFFEEVLGQNLPVTEFVHSDWSILNERLAKHYGIGGIAGMDMRRVSLPPEAHRGGVITQASVLKLTTNATYTSPIKRGAWILERILGTPPSPPPPAIEAIEPDIRGAVTIREQMAAHKTQAVCASCHVQIDPPGFALESFDVVGGWRERYRVGTGNSQPGDKKEYVELANYPGSKVWLARPVETDGETPDGEAFAGIDDYKQLLLRDPDQIARNLAEKLLVYGTGAPLDFADRAAVEEIVAAAKADGYGFRTLLHAVVRSRVFQHK